MKYHRIPKNELEKLEDDFIKFLVVNGITADDWLAIKENEPVNADQIINQFSDVVWEGILRKIKYLNKVEKDFAYYFKCDATEIHLVRVISAEKINEYHTATKSYSKQRELELFEMIQNGCMISEGLEFKELS
ncbi:MAG TPA: hypothetical protein DD396_05495 [Bacteroidetes bacterium]|jgi:hypothetical protein|nr:hypothetical protein [Bacteroidota bacterium]|tara:strand:+ start:3439 stop:3837 length:399 start_codon:yes stop_codon:yes gene_type:complete